jgi:hypothetical protein
VQKKYWLASALIMLIVFGGLVVAVKEGVLRISVDEEIWR